MAKANNNIFVRNLSGSLGDQFVIRKGRGGETIVSNMPTSSDNRKFNQNELDHQEAFRNAIQYAQNSKDDEVYIKKAAGTNMTPFNAAVADWFKKPQILEIDASEWKGQAGKVIWVQATDDTLVTEVYVKISDQTGAVLEEGDAQHAGGLWWTYTANTTVPMEPKPHVVVTAVDQPGHYGKLEWQS
jgi:hypothetical protein